MAGDEDQETGRRGSLLTLPVRFLLHWIIKVVVLLFLGIRFLLRPRAVRYGLVLLLVVGTLGWNVAGGSILGAKSSALQSADQSGATTSTQAANQLPPSPVVEKYLQAQASFNGKAMWELISDDMKSSMQASDASVQQLQAELDTAKKQGRRYNGATYVGGVPISQGRSVYFYVLSVDGPGGTNEVPYIYIVGSDGKIVSIQ